MTILAAPAKPVPGIARLAAYFAVAVVTSTAAGVSATTFSDAWSRIDPLNAAGLGLLYFGPMCLVLALGPMQRHAVVVCCVVLAAGIAGMWTAFASNDSSTSALIFLWGWVAGVPLAAVVAAVSWWRSR
ncbi:MAG TPA: hypothetical protein VM345_00425 [Acidimicrobiales bacterium]|nr:hypothetical protein [Acidimicrobiales bacterium]